MKQLSLVFIIILISSSLFSQAPDTTWIKQYNNYNGSTCSFYSIISTIDASFIAVGYHGDNENNTQISIIKTNNQGDSLWGVSIPSGKAYDIINFDDSSFLVVGTFLDTKDNYDIELIHINLNGDIINESRYGGSGDNYGMSVCRIDSSRFFISGYTLDNGNSFPWIMKINNNLDSLYSKCFIPYTQDYTFTN